MLSSISQESLRRCRLELEDQPLERASLFPFFDDAGRTRMVMIAGAGDGRIMLVDWTPDLFTRRWPRRNRVQRRFADLHNASAEEAERFGDLWHFDPWWVLGEERYSVHGAGPVLRKTNLPGHDERVSRIWFDRTLSRVVYVATGSGESLRARRFAEGTLTEAARARRDSSSPRLPAGDSRGEWRLRPFWQ